MVKPGSKLARTYAPRRLRDVDYSNSSHAFFMTIRAQPDGPATPFADARLAQAVVDALFWLRTDRGLAIYAYCLMPDHLHLLVQLADGSPALGDIIASMKKYTTRQSWTMGYSGKLWQERFHDHILRHSENAAATMHYILENPVRKGLTESAAAYPWQSTPDPTEPVLLRHPSPLVPL